VVREAILRLRVVQQLGEGTASCFSSGSPKKSQPRHPLDAADPARIPARHRDDLRRWRLTGTPRAMPCHGACSLHLRLTP
jgi:hypothetical protein